MPTVSYIPTAAPISHPSSELPTLSPSFSNSCSNDENVVLLQLETDGSVATMKWEIKDVLTKNVVKEGSVSDANTKYALKLCIPKDSCA